MTPAESSLRAFLSSQFPQVLQIAAQYGPMYSMSFTSAIRYAVGLLGDSLSDADYARILAAVETAERGAVVGGTGGSATGSGMFTAPVLLALGAAALLLLKK